MRALRRRDSQTINTHFFIFNEVSQNFLFIRLSVVQSFSAIRYNSPCIFYIPSGIYIKSSCQVMRTRYESVCLCFLLILLLLCYIYICIYCFLIHFHISTGIAVNINKNVKKKRKNKILSIFSLVMCNMFYFYMHLIINFI